jgi:phosphoribosylcarboxyaminoimidazole (NCAIR) mutase
MTLGLTTFPTRVGIVMGSDSDWPVMVPRACAA